MPGLDPLCSVTLPFPVTILEQAVKTLGRLQERRRPLGELNWIFITITVTIAWNTLPLPSFKKLGGQEVNPDKPDDDGRTPLSVATWNGHEGVVKILLGREEVNPDKPDNDGQTPLPHAARRGHERVVALL